MQKVLIVDDNQDNRRIIRIVLENMGYAAIEKENGRKGIDALTQDAFCLVILDLEMPEIRGLDVLKLMRASDKWRNIPVVVVTANHHMVEQNIENLADYVLFKPIDVIQLQHLLNRILNA